MAIFSGSRCPLYSMGTDVAAWCMAPESESVWLACPALSPPEKSQSLGMDLTLKQRPRCTSQFTTCGWDESGWGESGWGER